MHQRLRLLLGNAAALGALLAASPAFAHIDLLDPPARAHGTAASGDTDIDQNSNQKLAPCGQTTNGRNLQRVTTYAPGETITVQVREETNHDSYIRVALDLDGDDDFVYREPIAPATQIPPETQEVAQAAEEALDSEHLLKVFRENNTVNGTVFNIDVTLPDVTCDNCTLQVIQLMYDTTQVYYHQCADLIISGDAAAGADAGAAGGTGGTGGSAGTGGTGGTGGAGGAAPSGTGGASSSSGGLGGTTSAGGSTAAAGTGGSGGTGATGGSAPVTSDPNDDDGGGCTISTHADRGVGGAGLAGLLALGLGLVVRRRR